MPPNTPPNPNPYPTPPTPESLPQPPQQQDPARYDFFMGSEQSGKKGLLPGSGSPMQKMLFIVGAFVVALILIALVVIMLSGSKGNTAPLLSVAQSQQEIIRVATDGAKNVRGSKLKNFAVTAQVAVASAQRETLAQLKKQGVKPKTKDLALLKKVDTDKALAAALAANTYDTTFTSTMTTELEGYTARLEDAAAVATTKSELALIEKHRTGAELLRKQMLDQ